MKLSCASCYHPKEIDCACPFCDDKETVFLCEKGHIMYEIENPLSPTGTTFICQVCFIENHTKSV